MSCVSGKVCSAKISGSRGSAGLPYLFRLLGSLHRTVLIHIKVPMR